MVEETVIKQTNGEITFFDTNILLPTSSWDLYRYNLIKQKYGTNYNVDNITLNEETINSALEEISVAKNYFSNCNSALVTPGVLKQTVGQMESIISNIWSRRQNFLFGEFNAIAPLDLKNKSKRIYENLLNYSTQLSSLKQNIQDKKYTPVPAESYFLILNLVRGLSDKFFDMGREDHKYDFNTDEEVVVSCLYEAIVNKSKTKVITNDNGVIALLGLSNTVLNKCSLITKTNENFAYFYANAPEAYKIVDIKTYQTELVDLNKKGEESVNNLSGFDTSQYLDETQKREYFRKVSSLGNFLDKTLVELVESLQKR